MFNSTFHLHRNIPFPFHFLKICCEFVNLKVLHIKLRLKRRVLPLKDTKLTSNTNDQARLIPVSLRKLQITS